MVNPHPRCCILVRCTCRASLLAPLLFQRAALLLSFSSFFVRLLFSFLLPRFIPFLIRVSLSPLLPLNRLPPPSLRFNYLSPYHRSLLALSSLVTACRSDPSLSLSPRPRGNAPPYRTLTSSLRLFSCSSRPSGDPYLIPSSTSSAAPRAHSAFFVLFFYFYFFLFLCRQE